MKSFSFVQAASGLTPVGSVDLDPLQGSNNVKHDSDHTSWVRLLLHFDMFQLASLCNLCCVVKLLFFLFMYLVR